MISLKVWGAGAAPFQGKAALRTLRKDYPEFWSELKRLDAKSPNTFKDRYSVERLEQRFAFKDAYINLFRTEKN